MSALASIVVGLLLSSVAAWQGTWGNAWKSPWANQANARTTSTPLTQDVWSVRTASTQPTRSGLRTQNSASTGWRSNAQSGSPMGWGSNMRTSSRSSTPAIEFPPRIVGGDEVPFGSHPSFALFTYNPSSFCGGTLIESDIVLTAAHCLKPEGLVGREIFVGGQSPQRNDAVSHKISEVKVHPDFAERSGGMYFDYMLLKLDRPSSLPTMPFNSRSDQPEDNAPVTTIGFGHTEFGGTSSNVLREVNVNIVNSDTCNSSYGGNLRSQIHMCAAADGRDACQNDSGGPLIQNGVVVGIVSFGQGCAMSGFPGVYARTSGATAFIKKGVCEISSNPPSYCDFTIPETSEAPSVPDVWYCPQIDLGPANFFLDVYKEIACCPNHPRVFGNPFC